MHDDDKHCNDEQEDIVYQNNGICLQGLFNHIGLVKNKYMNGRA